MKGTIMAIISFLLFAGRSCSGRLLENNLFIASDKPSAFNPDLNSVVDDGSRLEEDTALHCDQDTSPWSSSSEKDAKIEQNKAEGVFHLQPKGKVTASGPNLKVYTMVTEQRLSTSKRSPGVGHMQMVRPKSQRINGDTFKSHHSNGDDKRNKRKLGSTPSPGGGH